MLVAVLVVLVVILVAATVRAFVWPDRFTISNARPVTSRVDGLSYRVHEGHAEAQRAADTLAGLNARVVDLMRFLRARYVRGGAGDQHPARRGAVERLLERYNPDNLAENSPKDPTGDTAYSLNKGAVVAICLRKKGPRARSPDDPDAFEIHDMGVLMFVTLHEMAHISIDQIDHPPRFWAAFRFLLEEAEDAGVYHSPDYAARPTEYCGVKVDYNPRYDAGVRPI